MPLAAIIDDKIICLHGGIGSSLNYIEEIDQLQRPLEVVHEVSNFEQQLVVDILWSDPTDTDTDTGIHPNTVRDPQGTGNIVKVLYIISYHIISYHIISYHIYVISYHIISYHIHVQYVR